MIQDHVRVGVWIKATATCRFNALLLTLPNKWGFVILATVAVLVTYASAQCWDIFRFAIYCYVESHYRHPEDYHTRQLQVTLRNSESAFSTLTGYLRIARTRRRKHYRQKRRLGHIILVVLLALTYNSAFIALGALAPLVLVENTAKIQPDNCGYWPINVASLLGISNHGDLLAGINQLAEFVSNGTSATTAYVRSCYGAEPENSSCNMMLNRRISWNGTHNAMCPFSAGQCVGGDNSAFMMDTGDISARYYGIDTPSSFTVRRQSTCSAIVTQPYMVDTEGGAGYSHVTFNGQNVTALTRDDVANPYLVEACYPQPGMTVHPNLQPTVGNTSVIYILRNNLTHIYPSSDPIFKATVEIPAPYVEVAYTPTWQDRVGALGCVDKLQICGTFDGRRECSAWAGVVKGEHGETGIEEFYNRCSTDNKGLISLLLPKTSVLQTIGDAARGSSPTLIASRSLLSLPFLPAEVQTAKGDEQWKQEVSQWFNIVLAVSQLAVLYLPIGPPFINTSQLVNEMVDESRFVCTKILINSFDHVSIRLAGVMVIVAGTLLIAIFTPRKSMLPCMRNIHWSRSAKRWFSDSASALLVRSGRHTADLDMEAGLVLGSLASEVPRSASKVGITQTRASESDTRSASQSERQSLVRGQSLDENSAELRDRSAGSVVAIAGGGSS